jgi:plastocyanin
MNIRYNLFFWGAILSSVVMAKEPEIVDHNRLMDHGDGHLMDMDGGMVMGQNKDKLPAGCDRISEDLQITVHAGRKYSKEFPGTMFGFDKHEWKVKPCTRLTVNFINEDNVRHQWMMHGLPKFMYDKGMFHLEVTGPAKVAGTLILPAEDKTYLVHCDIAQHMEKGMKGQLVVGKGSGTFPTIPGITDPAIADNYGPGPLTASVPPVAPAPSSASSAGSPAASVGDTTGTSGSGSWLSGSLILGVIGGVAGAPYLARFYNQKISGRPFGEVVRFLFAKLQTVLKYLLELVLWVYRWASSQVKRLPKQ